MMPTDNEHIRRAYTEYGTLPGLRELRETATPFVGGDGPVPNRIMFIGEAPGKEEARLRRPFVGDSGRLLDEMLDDAGLRRAEVFITNAVKFRPPGNRNPTSEELEASKPCLRVEVKEVNPDVVCTLGAIPLSVVFPQLKLGESHGIPIVHNGRAWLPLYHPAYGVRRRDMIPTLQADINKLKGLLL